MSNCVRFVAHRENIESAELFPKLLELTGSEEAADTLYAELREPSFIEKFGNYMRPFNDVSNDRDMKDRVDIVGEPKLFLNNELNRYYYLDKDNEPVFFPDNQGISQYLETNDIKTLAQIMALKYYELNDYDYESLSFRLTNNKKLETVIKEFLSYKSDELQNSDDDLQMMLGFNIEDSMSFIPEWIVEIQDFYSTLGLKIREDEISEQEESEEETRGEVFRKEAFLRSQKNSVSNNVKLFLSLLKNTKVNDFEEFGFVPFDDIYATLNKALANNISIHDSQGELEDLYDVFLDEIKKISKYKPYLKQLYQELKNIPNENSLFKNQFVSAFNLYSKNFLGSEIVRTKKGIAYDVRNLSNVSSRKSTVLSMWTFNAERKKLKPAKFKYVRQELLKLTNSFNPQKITEKELSKLSNDLKGLFQTIGIELSDAGFSYYLEQNGTELASRVNVFSQTISQYNRMIEEVEKDELRPGLIRSKSLFVKMAEAEAFFLEEGTDASFFSIGKTKWVYSLPSHLERKIAEWKKNPELLDKHYKSSQYTRGSHYMKYLLAYDVPEDERLEKRVERINDIEVFVFNSVQSKGEGKNATDNKNISYTDSLNDYINKLLLNPRLGRVYHKTALAADKSTEYQISWGVNSNVFAELVNLAFDKKTGKPIIDFDIIDIFYNYFKAEYNRIADVHNDIEQDKEFQAFAKEQGEDLPSELIEHYHTGVSNGKKSQLFPSLSPEIDSDGGVTLPDTATPLYDETGKPLYDDLDLVKEQILPTIEAALARKFQETALLIKENNLVYYDENGVLKNGSIDSRVFDSYLKEAGKDAELALQKLAADVSVNSLISQVEYAMMITGDVAYYKDILDYKKRVPATYTDGLYMRLLSGEEYFNISVIASVTIPTPNLKALKKHLEPKIYEKYKQVNSTDAQAWITPQRWKFIMEKLGKWSPTVESVYNKFFESNPMFTNKELKILAQPLKGVYFDVGTTGRPIYLKYSQAVLLPNLIKGTPLAKLYDKMVKNENGKEKPYNEQIHELITADGIKVGSPSPTVTHDEVGNIIDDFKLHPTKLFNKSWKLQQDLPTKSVKDTDIGSQIQKNIFQGLAFNRDTEFDIKDENGEYMNGTDLIKYIHNLYGAMSHQGVERILSRLGVDKDTFKINDEAGLYANIISQLSKRADVPKNLIKALRAHVSPYGIPGAQALFQNVFSTIINKEIIKLKTNGGEFIQVADYGLSKTEAKEKGILFTPWFDEAERLSPPTIYTNPYTKKETVNPGGVFISGAMIAKYIPNYKELSSEKLFGKLNKQTGEYEGGRIDNRILQNIIGYRIPNQYLSSNDPLQVMGILPEEMGNTVVAYTGITEKTGSDFDIDKMYLMIPAFRPLYTKDATQKVINFIFDSGLSLRDVKDELILLGYSYSALTPQQINELFADTVLNNQDSSYAEAFNESIQLKSARKLLYVELEEGVPLWQQNEKALQNRLIEAYKAVLTSPAAYNKLMNPIEVDYIKNDIKNLVSKSEVKDLDNLSAIDDLKLKDEFRLGKAGLGQNINSLVDSVRGSMSELYLIDHYLGWGLVDEKGQTVFDREFSEILSDDEIKEYVDSYNASVPEGGKPVTFEQIKEIASVALNESMMGYVNGFVDIAKDSYVVQGNWVTSTNPIGFMLLRAGVHPFKVNAFLAQPILKEYVQYVANGRSNAVDNETTPQLGFRLKKAKELAAKKGEIRYGDVNIEKEHLFDRLFNPKSIIRVFNSLDTPNYDMQKSKFLKAAKTKFYKTFDKKKSENIKELEEVFTELVSIYDTIFESVPLDFNTISLSALRGQVTSNPDVEIQLPILDKFLSWSRNAREITTNIKASRVDVDGKGKNITSLITNVNRIKELLDNRDTGTLGGFVSKLHFEGKHTSLNHAIINSLTIPFKIMQANPKFFLTANESTINTFNLISKFVKGTRLTDEDLADRLENAYYSYILSDFPPLRMTNEEKADMITNMPDEMKEMQKKYPRNTLLKELYAKESNKKSLFYVGMSNIRKSASHKNKITDSWKDLLQSEPEFAEKLIKYSFLISGFNNSISQFHEYIPYEWFNKNRFNSFLKNLQFNNAPVDRNFLDQFMRHYIEDPDFTRPIYSSQIKRFEGDKNIWNGFKAPADLKDPSYLVKYTIQSESMAEPVDLYYKLEGQKEETGEYVYTRTSGLGRNDGKGNILTEYDRTTVGLANNKETLFTENDSQLKGASAKRIKGVRKYFQDLFDDRIDEIETDIKEIEDATISDVVNDIEVTTDNNLTVDEAKARIDQVGTFDAFVKESVQPDSIKESKFKIEGNSLIQKVDDRISVRFPAIIKDINGDSIPVQKILELKEAGKTNNVFSKGFPQTYHDEIEKRWGTETADLAWDLEEEFTVEQLDFIKNNPKVFSNIIYDTKEIKENPSLPLEELVNKIIGNIEVTYVDKNQTSFDFFDENCN